MINSVKEKVLQFIDRNLPTWLITIGVCLRLKHFLDNRSLWLDEAYVGLHVRIQGFSKILLNAPCLKDLPVPPMGFMFFEKVATFFGGDNEFALRFFPLICGCLSIGLFYALAKKVLPRRESILALALFVFSDFLIYYSAEVKQYSLELLCSLLLMLLFFLCRKEGADRKRFWGEIALGAFVLTSSHQSVFVLAGYVCVRGFELAKNKDGEAFKRLVFQCVAWGCVFWVWFFGAMSFMIGNSIIIKGAAQSNYFFPGLSAGKALPWLGQAFWSLFQRPGGLFFSGIPIVFFLFGARVFFKKERRTAAFFVLPVFFALLASFLQKYPFHGRFLIFVVPGMFIFIAKGAGFLSQKIRRFEMTAFVLFAAMLLLVPMKRSAEFFAKGRQVEESRDLIRHMKQNYKSQDIIFLNEFSLLPFFYYFGQGKIVPEIDMILMTDGLYKKGKRIFVGAMFHPVCFDVEENFYGISPKEGEFVFVEKGATTAFPEAWGRKKWVLFSHRYTSKQIVLDVLKHKNTTYLYGMKKRKAELYVFGKK